MLGGIYRLTDKKEFKNINTKGKPCMTTALNMVQKIQQAILYCSEHKEQFNG